MTRTTRESWPAAAWRIVRLVLLVDAVVAVAVGALGWLLGWQTRAAWGEAFVWSGLGAIVLGALAVRGGWDSRLAHVGFAASVGQASLAERTRLMMGDVNAGYRRILFLTLVGVPLLALGLWLDPRA